MMDYTFRDYSRCVESVGGLPVLVPVVEKPETIQAVIQRVDGLILTGGPDICPRFYGEEPILGMGEMDYSLDVMELEAARSADKRNIPILGVCRGIQTIAVAFGGTLYQDIPTQVSPCIDHGQKADKGVNTHRITITNPSRLFNILGEETLWVNSRHHQAVKTLPRGFVATATATDGVIEAIERPHHPFLLGVQWHPEGTWIRDDASRRLFGALVQAAENRQ
jgi:putative glutamine amidotransferase